MSQRPAPHGIPASHLLQLFEITKRWGVTEQDLLPVLQVRRDDLLDPDVSIPVPIVEAFIERARVLTREPALGMYMGLQMSISAHGFLGFAAMSAATLGDALALSVRYTPTRTTALSVSLRLSGRTAALVLEEQADFGKARDVILLGFLVGLWQIGNVLLGREVRESTVHVTFAEPAYYVRFRQVAPRVRFGQSANRLVFDAALLNAPLVSADPASLRLAREQCERLLDSISSRSRFGDRARRLVLRSEGGARSLEELASVINVSSRTLRRRLADEGASYSSMLDEERHARALLLLRSPELSVKDVAQRLGYSDVANFMRAFRRWTGQTPAAFRREGLS
jgi:AraC-like DNA-binding protein